MAASAMVAGEERNYVDGQIMYRCLAGRSRLVEAAGLGERSNVEAGLGPRLRPANQMHCISRTTCFGPRLNSSVWGSEKRPPRGPGACRRQPSRHVFVLGLGRPPGVASHGSSLVLSLLPRRSIDEREIGTIESKINFTPAVFP